ncbi:amidohydrolase [Pseudaquidulcibacter saccharophilus]|uniref:amidohydrolase n=1 Tax=Pseudaquidulcibacter saccharophilus TaxID=2831900 RepID=UPI001EFF05FE|nr:amidohydrolase [Pseudaquidulcibacter saccharophilus]
MTMAFIAICNNAKADEITPDIILFNGKIFTGDEVKNATAIAISGNIISAVGLDNDIKKFASSNTKSYDLKGHLVIPGINDAHVHLSVWPKSTYFLETPTFDPSWEEVAKEINKATALKDKVSFIFGTMGPKIFYDTNINRQSLDKIAPNHPLIILMFDGHSAILNSAALAKLGFDEKTPDPIGGKFERDANGKLNGILREYAVTSELNTHFAAVTSEDDSVRALKIQLNQAISFGITTIQDMPSDMSVTRSIELLEKSQTPIRVRVTRMNHTTKDGFDLNTDQVTPSSKNPLIRTNGTKWIIDGVVFEGSLTPREDAKTLFGKDDGPYTVTNLPILFNSKQIEKLLQDSLENNYQIQFHIFGRPGAIAVLDAMDKTGGPKIWAGRRVRFEHGDGITPDLLDRIKANGIIVSQQATHLDISEVSAEKGAIIAKNIQDSKAQPLKSLIDKGIPVVLGSDGPLNPYIGILLASVHPDNPEEAISREQALLAYTKQSAFAEYQEAVKGTLSVGKLADLAVLSDDILTIAPPELPKVSSVLTIIDGKIVYDAKKLSEN